MSKYLMYNSKFWELALKNKINPISYYKSTNWKKLWVVRKKH